MKGIVWLASYPKSGNTWFRIFLTNYLRDADSPAQINDLEGASIASARQPFDTLVGFDSGEMTFDEIDRLRPEVYRYQAEQATERLYCKVHDAYTFLPDGRPLFPPEASDCALYFIRNPLDVAVSLTQYAGHGRLDATIRQMGRADNSYCDVNAWEPSQLRQRVLTWSGHVTSWTVAPGMRVQVIRYEDMKLRPEQTFASAIRFLNLPDEPLRIGKAIEFSRFEELKRQEEKGGFGEKIPQAEVFFRKGEVGSWRQVLTPLQVKKLINDHRDVMISHGYLNEYGEPVF